MTTLRIELLEGPWPLSPGNSLSWDADEKSPWPPPAGVDFENASARRVSKVLLVGLVTELVHRHRLARGVDCDLPRGPCHVETHMKVLM